VCDSSNATHDRPIPSIGTIFNIISKSLVFGIVGYIPENVLNKEEQSLSSLIPEKSKGKR
jgi:hypothetical protein